MRRSLVIVSLISLLGPVTCTKGGNVRVRPTAYAPDFNYISTSDLKSVMGQLAIEMRRLSDQLAPAGDGDVPAVEVAATLRRMDRTAAVLDSPATTTNHPRINQHIERLRFDIRRSLRGVSLEPPNYFWAESLGESCRYCHESRE